VGIDYWGFHTTWFHVLFHQTVEAQGSGADCQYRSGRAADDRSEAGCKATIDSTDGIGFGRRTLFAILVAAYRNLFGFRWRFCMRRYHGGGGLRHLWVQIEEAMTKIDKGRALCLFNAFSRVALVANLWHAVLPFRSNLAFNSDALKRAG
jgi:hypothetical protein